MLGERCPDAHVTNLSTKGAVVTGRVRTIICRVLSKHTGDGISRGFSDAPTTAPRRRGLESVTSSINTSFFTISRAQCRQAIYKQGDNLLIDVVLGKLMRINCTLSVSLVLSEETVAIRDLLVGVNHSVYAFTFIDNRVFTAIFLY